MDKTHLITTTYRFASLHILIVLITHYSIDFETERKKNEAKVFINFGSTPIDSSSNKRTWGRSTHLVYTVTMQTIVNNIILYMRPLAMRSYWLHETNLHNFQYKVLATDLSPRANKIEVANLF